MGEYADMKGKIKLNKNLICRQNLTNVEVRHIEKLHDARLDILEQMLTETDPDKLVNLALMHRCNQFSLQKAWKFPLNADFHDWYEVPGCTCPKMDNQDMKGTPYHIYSGDCKIHNHPDWRNSNE